MLATLLMYMYMRNSKVQAPTPEGHQKELDEVKRIHSEASEASGAAHARKLASFPDCPAFPAFSERLMQL